LKARKVEAKAFPSNTASSVGEDPTGFQEKAASSEHTKSNLKNTEKIKRF